MSEAQIDYSRPVGWWCPVCGNTDHVSSIGPDGRERQRFCIQSARTGFCFRRAIPRYLPIPEGQRPPAASEVEEAEVVTFTSLMTGRFRISGVDIEIGHDGNARGSWSDEGELVLDPDTVVNFCAEQSARARIVTGAIK